MNLRLDGRNLVQRWELLQQGKNKKYKYVWRKQDFDAVDPNDTDYLLGKKNCNEGSHWCIYINHKLQTKKAYTRIYLYIVKRLIDTISLTGLFSPSHMQYELERDTSGDGEPSLAEMTDKAIKILRRNKNGFALMVEGNKLCILYFD